MNNLFLTTLTYFIISTSCYCQQKTDLQKDNLKGNVKSLKYSDYSVTEKFGEIQKGQLTRSYTYNYNSNGNYKTSDEKTKYYYNLKNRLTKIEHFGNSFDQKYYQTFLYDERGNNIEQTTFSNDGEIRDKNKSKYNQNNLMIENNSYRSNGDLETRTIYKHDSKGNEITTSRYNPDGNLRVRGDMKYDERGNCIETEVRMPIDLISRRSKKYNSRNDVISDEITYTNDSMQKYNSKITKELKYDNKGNIISLSYYKDGIADTLTIYEIEYY